MRIRRNATVVLAAAGLILAGCGYTPEERGISGAGIGASAGAILGAVTGMTVLQGAVIGAVAGGLAGAVTDNDTINLGDPLWKRGQGPRASAAPANAPAASPASTDAPGASKADVVAIQTGLGALGYNPGRADGKVGARTRNAIRAYQQDNKLLVDGRPTPQLARHIGAEINKLTQMTRALDQVPQQ